jgi:hypothetical protein
VFILFQVGDDAEAKEFINAIAAHDDMGGMLHCSGDSLDKVYEVLEEALAKEGTSDKNKFKRYVSDSYCQASHPCSTFCAYFWLIYLPDFGLKMLNEFINAISNEM